MAYLVDDDLYPYSSVCFIQARWGDVWYVGSGVLVGRNDVLTASHVIYDIALGGLADEIIVMPSYDATYSSQVGVSDDGVYHSVFTQYYTDFDPDGDGLVYSGDGTVAGYGGAERDVALITLGEAAGDVYGWMGIDTNFSSGSINLTGHPSALDNFSSNTQGQTYADSVDWFFSISSFGVSPGNSGGPLWYDNGSGPRVIGVVSTGIAAADLGAHQWLINAIGANDHYMGGVAPAVENHVGSSAVLDFHYVSGTRSQYSLTGDLASATLTHLNSGSDGTDRLTSIDRIVFADGILALDIEGTAGQAYRIYEAAFDRTPDLGGLSYWIDRMDDGTGVRQVAADFINSREFIAMYGAGVTNQQLVEGLYQNILDRPGTTADINYWVGQLNSGVRDRAMVLADFSESNENRANVDLSDGIWYV